MSTSTNNFKKISYKWRVIILNNISLQNISANWKSLKKARQMLQAFTIHNGGPGKGFNVKNNTI